MGTTLTTIDVSKWQSPDQIDWDGLKAQGLKSIIIQLSHGSEREPKADAFLAKAKSEKLIAHGYHFYEGSTQEFSFAVKNAQELGLGQGAYFFLDMEGDISGNWNAQFQPFRSMVAQNGWHPGLYISAKPYADRFDDKQMVSLGVYRWIADYGAEPPNYDAWQYSNGDGKLDHTYDKAGKLEVDYTKNQPRRGNNEHYFEPGPRQPLTPKANSWVGWGVDSSGLGGGRTIGYSTDGNNFYAALWPGGLVFRQPDAEHFWPLLKPYIQAMLDKWTGGKVDWQNIENKPDVVTNSELTAELSNYRKTSDDVPWDEISGKPQLATEDDLSKISSKPGPPGKDGSNGKDGKDGLSAYQVAVNNGFTGTAQEWLNSLRGQPGRDGVDGKPGKDGSPGEDGHDGVTPHIDATTGHWFVGTTDTGVSAQGPQGLPGSPGRDGKDGQTPDVTEFATIAGLDEVRTTAESASSAASSAQSAAQEAQSTASSASSEASSAYSLASTANRTANSAFDRINKIDTSNLTKVKEPSAYPDGSISYEVKSVSYLGLYRSGIASELQSGSTAIVTTKAYNGMARQTAEIIDSQVPATFIRNGYQSTWSSWYISQLTAM